MTAVFEESKQPGSKRLLLLAIADNANDYGHAFPGIRRLARKTMMSERTTMRAIEEIWVTSDELLVYKENGEVNHYLVLTGFSPAQREMAIARFCEKLRITPTDLDQQRNEAIKTFYERRQRKRLARDKSSSPLPVTNCHYPTSDTAVSPGSDTAVSPGSDTAVSPESSVTVSKSSSAPAETGAGQKTAARTRPRDLLFEAICEHIGGVSYSQATKRTKGYTRAVLAEIHARERDGIPPVMVEEIKTLRQRYKQTCPNLAFPTEPAKVADWLFRLRSVATNDSLRVVRAEILP